MLCPTCGNEQLLAVGPGRQGLRCRALREFPGDLYLCVCPHLPGMGPRGPRGQSTWVQLSPPPPRCLPRRDASSRRLGNCPVISAIQMEAL